MGSTSELCGTGLTFFNLQSNKKKKSRKECDNKIDKQQSLIINFKIRKWYNQPVTKASARFKEQCHDNVHKTRMPKHTAKSNVLYTEQQQQQNSVYNLRGTPPDKPEESSYIGEGSTKSYPYFDSSIASNSASSSLKWDNVEEKRWSGTCRALLTSNEEEKRWVRACRALLTSNEEESTKKISVRYWSARYCDFSFKILSDLSEAVPDHLANESLTRQPDTPLDHPQDRGWSGGVSG